MILRHYKLRFIRDKVQWLWAISEIEFNITQRWPHNENRCLCNWNGLGGSKYGEFKMK